MQVPSSDDWRRACAEDVEFMQAARHWTGGLRLGIGEQVLTMAVNDGQPSEPAENTELIEYHGEQAVWERLLAEVPPPGDTDVLTNLAAGGGLRRDGDYMRLAQYHAAVMRAIELLRPVGSAAPSDQASTMPGAQATEVRPEGHIDTPAGRYVHLSILGQDHRVYFEEAGQGIPLLLQHTAGAHGSQWRHLMEAPEITDKFRLIAYDLPFHGKSLPPVSREWWSEEYRLRGEFLRETVIAIKRALGLERPVFMGCSVGGLLALDLARRHPEEFRDVISLEGALEIPGGMAMYQQLWSPQISNDYKARVMEGIMSPTSPKVYRKETAYVYSSGWPATFLGDLHYYLEDFDIRETASEIDTNQVGVHILSGEYDYSATPEMGRAAHEAIPGSTWALMKGVGHFPMCENPDIFLKYLLPILGRIAH